MFALARKPPQRITAAGGEYRLRRVFKHDFFAATCLYEATGAADPRRIVVKFSRQQPFLGIGFAWYARWMRRHEGAIYRALAGLEGVPRWVGPVQPGGYAIEYIDAAPLDHLDTPPPGFFDRLVALMGHIHQRGVAYCDANKRSNILVDKTGRPWLVDFQISFRRRDDWPWPARNAVARAVAYVAQRDLYHIYKHKRRLAPAELTEEEDRLSRHRSGLHLVHRKLTKPWRALRRRFLHRRHRQGRLVSPTEQLEDHHQPEKATWRND
jgi:hypothetical protein